MERELLLTGIGGQGVQLAAAVLAQAAVAEGREVQLFGSYGGMMRGGATEATVVVADEPIEAPPTVEPAWSAVSCTTSTPRRRWPGCDRAVSSSSTRPHHRAAGARGRARRRVAAS